MENRLRKVEHGLSELHADFRVMSATLVSIDKTLQSFKNVGNDLVDLRLTVVSTTNIAKDAQSKANNLFDKYDSLHETVSKLHETDHIQNVKIGGGERFLWLLITVVVGFVVAKLKEL